jgi:hypothetical protein
MNPETSNTPKRDAFWRKYSELKSELFLKIHGIWWGFLWAIKLGKPYSKLICRLNLYRKFPDGRCQYCGVIK